MSAESDILDVTRRSVWFEIDLDALTQNISAIRKCINKTAGVCAMVKGNGYGHGAVQLSRHLKEIGVERLGVATVEEGIQLRYAGIQGPLHLMGNLQPWEAELCLSYDLIATVSSEEAIRGVAEALARKLKKGYRKAEYINGDVEINHNETKNLGKLPKEGTVHIKVDSGMSRNGCQPEELPQLMKLCEDLHVPCEGIYTHFADFENIDYTKSQMDTFYKAIEPFRKDNLMLFHASNSGGIVTGVGTELDMVRPGISIYGLPPGADIADFSSKGFKPIGQIKAVATLVKELVKGRKVGYGTTYETTNSEWIATIPFGYADGYFRLLSNKGIVVRDLTGEKCPVVGRVSMDAITIRLPRKTRENEVFTLITDNYDAETSATGIANTLDTINYEVTTRISTRVPRIYKQSKGDGKMLLDRMCPEF